MVSNLSVASDLANLLNDSYNGSYALVSMAEPQHGMCMAYDQPEYDKPDIDVELEQMSPGFIICCILVTLILFMALVNLVLVAFTFMLAIFVLVKKFFRRTDLNENRHEIDRDPIIPTQPIPIPAEVDSRSPKGDQPTTRRHRRQRGSARTPPNPPPPPPPTASCSLPSASVPPMAALIGTPRVSPEAAKVASSAAAGTFDSSRKDSFAESSDDRAGGIVETEFQGIEQPGSYRIRFIGSHPKKPNHVYQETQRTLESDGSDGRLDEDEDSDHFFAAVDPASAQHSDSDRKESKTQQHENHRSSKSARKGMDIPSVSAETSWGARCDKKSEQQTLSNDRRGSPPKERLPSVSMVAPHRLCDLGGNSDMIPDGKDNDWLCCGIERRSGEDRVRRSGSCNDSTCPSVEPVPILPAARYGSNSFEKNWEPRAPVTVQRKREFGMYCDALAAIDALLEEDDYSAVEEEPVGRNHIIQLKDSLLAAEQQQQQQEEMSARRI